MTTLTEQAVQRNLGAAAHAIGRHGPDGFGRDRADLRAARLRNSDSLSASPTHRDYFPCVQLHQFES